ncbi:MAG: argininosuccinate lyase, partial [Planctomycetales bacterium]|nr:argininosuccinate lyase [Planctomycetales bacterium]
KPPLFDAVDTVDACLELAAPLVAGAQLKTAAIAERLDRGYLDATTLMEALIRQGLPQRTAHHLVGKLVALAMEHDVRLADLTVAELQAAEPSLDESVYEALGVENALARFVSYGSTAPTEVKRQTELWKQKLKFVTP